MLYNKWTDRNVTWENAGPFPWSGMKDFSGIAPIPTVLD